MNKNICFFNPTELVRRPISELAGRLDNSNIAIFTPANKNNNVLHHQKYSNHIKMIKYKYFSLPVEFEWPIPKLDFFKKLKYVRKNYDVFHIWTHFYLSILFSVFYLKQVKNKKVIITLDTIPGESFKTNIIIDSLFYVFNRTIGKLILNKCDSITVYSGILKKILIKRMNIKTKINVIYTGVNYIDISKVKKDIVRKELNINSKTPIISFVGLPGLRKGIDYFIKVANKFPNYIFLVVGDSPKRKYFQSISPNNIIYLGKRKDIWNIYKDSDILFLPSRGEGLPGVVMEAMVAKLPVISSNIPCVGDLIRNGTDGYLCDIGNMNQYVEATVSIINNNHKTKKMIVSANKRIKKLFDWNTLIKEYIKLY